MTDHMLPEIIASVGAVFVIIPTIYFAIKFVGYIIVVLMTYPVEYTMVGALLIGLLLLRLSIYLDQRHTVL